MQTTPNYGLEQPQSNDTIDLVSLITNNTNIIDSQMKANANAGIPYAVDSSNTANTVIVTLNPAPKAYTDGFAVCVKIANATTGAATLNVNGLGAIPLMNGDGSAVGAGDLVAGIPVTFRYAGGASPAFIASGSGGLSGTGNATAADVLSPYTFTSSGGKKQSGTMANQGAVTLTPSGNGTVAIPQGYHNGQGKVAQVAITAAHLLSGDTVAGVAGTMPNNGGVTLTPSGTGTVAIPAGYHDGTGKVAQVSVPATNVLTGTTIAGVAGTMPNKGAPTFQPGTSAQAIAAGYYSGGQVNGDANLQAGNIKSGVSIFGVAGNLSPLHFASGTASDASNYLVTVSGLTFQPRVIYLFNNETLNMDMVYCSDYSTTSYFTAAKSGFEPVSSNGGYVNSTGFALWTGYGTYGNSFNWYAYG